MFDSMQMKESFLAFHIEPKDRNDITRDHTRQQKSIDAREGEVSPQKEQQQENQDLDEIINKEQEEEEHKEYKEEEEEI